MCVCVCVCVCDVCVRVYMCMRASTSSRPGSVYVILCLHVRAHCQAPVMIFQPMNVLGPNRAMFALSASRS